MSDDKGKMPIIDTLPAGSVVTSVTPLGFSATLPDGTEVTYSIDLRDGAATASVRITPPASIPRPAPPASEIAGKRVRLGEDLYWEEY
jgi:hypothetical protein